LKGNGASRSRARPSACPIRPETDAAKGTGEPDDAAQAIADDTAEAVADATEAVDDATVEAADATEATKPKKST